MILPTITAFELSVHLFNSDAPTSLQECSADIDVPSTATYLEQIKTGLTAYVRFLDPEVSALRNEITLVRTASEAAVAFIKGSVLDRNKDHERLESVVGYAISALDALDFLGNKFIQVFLNFLANM